METQPQGQAKPQNPQRAAQQRIIAAGMKILYAKRETTMQIVEMVKNAPDPANGIAQAAMLIVQQLGQMAKGIDPRLAISVAPVLAVLIAELATKAGVIPDEGAIVGQAIELIKRQVMAPQQGRQGAPALAQPQQPPQEQQPAAQPQQGVVAGAMEG